MKQFELDWNQNTLPEDIALNIASFLQISELCCLGSCSKFWRELCASDCLWVSLSRNRWPSLGISPNSPIPLIISNKESPSEDIEQAVKGWRSFYIRKHNDMGGKATGIIKFVEERSASKCLEVGDFVKAAQTLRSMDFTFKDVVIFFFVSKQNVLLNLVGLHYCILFLKVQVEDLVEALGSCNISDRQVCVNWWKLGRWFYGFRMRDESHTRRLSLGDLALAKENEVLGVLQRGAIHEVLRVQISIPDPACSTWVWKDVHAEG